ncbi:hypothetical protein Lsan_2677 [Legionella santicrucis]|uniref:UPF0391 membrane protein Lsan_2677 n=1 Tax=Legionella santicrucis TaxID=45074 RepID=A0A0W0YK36_9GAMM|nr:DUF1328 family protein [Legionella santicrucis]KTD57055.1 hypothetical protein Lsan_2677 [Legionella santicrucis]
MLDWAIFFFTIAIIAAVLSFRGIAGAAAGVAQICTKYSTLKLIQLDLMIQA